MNRTMQLMGATLFSALLSGVAMAHPGQGYGFGPGAGMGPGMGPGMGGMGPGRGMGPGAGMGPCGGMGSPMMAGQLMQFMEQQLQLTEEQKPAWDKFKSQRDAHHAEMQAHHQQRMQGGERGMHNLPQKIERMEGHLASMKTMAAAYADFSAVLSDEQRQVLESMPQRGPMGFSGPRGMMR